MMASIVIHTDTSPLRTDPDGSIRVGESQVMLAVLLNAYLDWGWSAEQLAEQFPSITLADVHGVLSYYLRHRQEVDIYLNEWNSSGEQSRSDWQQSTDGQLVITKLRAARLARNQP